jgi:hypothetical protein
MGQALWKVNHEKKKKANAEEPDTVTPPSVHQTDKDPEEHWHTQSNCSAESECPGVRTR